MTNDDATPLYLPDDLMQRYGPEATARVHGLRIAPQQDHDAPTTRISRVRRQLAAAAVAVLLIMWLPAAWVGFGVLLGLTIATVHIVRCDSRPVQTARTRQPHPD